MTRLAIGADLEQSSDMSDATAVDRHITANQLGYVFLGGKFQANTTAILLGTSVRRVMNLEHQLGAGWD